jgi:hypothetical protein
MMLTDPKTVRWKERVKIGKATIDGVSIANKEKTLQWGRELLEYRARVTAEAITKTIAGKPNPS